MTISREDLEARRIALTLDYQLVVGHLQEIDHWLAQLDREADGPSPDRSDDSGPSAEE